MEDELTYERWPLPWKTTSPMEGDLSYGRWPFLWKTTSPIKGNLSYERWPHLWKTTSHMKGYLSYGRQPILWKTTSPIEKDLSYGRLPLLWKTTSKNYILGPKGPFGGPEGPSQVAVNHQPSAEVWLLLGLFQYWSTISTNLIILRIKIIYFMFNSILKNGRHIDLRECRKESRICSLRKHISAVEPSFAQYSVFCLFVPFF